jgi:hypothetical protein
MAGDFSMQFAAGQRVSVPDPTKVLALDPSNPSFTIEAWLKFATPAARAVYFYDNGPGGAVSASVFTNRTAFVTTLGILDRSSAAAIPNDGGWHHIAVVHDNAKEFRFYVDGVLGDTIVYTNGVIFTRTNEIFYIGSENTGGLQYVGLIDRLRYTKRALRPDQLDSVANPIRIGLNFGADEYPNSPNAGTLAAATLAGVVPQANWNNLRLNNGTNSALVIDSAGRAVATAASVTWSSPNTWSSTGRGEENNGFPIGGDRTLMTGYLDTDNAAGVARITVSGLDPALTAGYDVIVYALGGTSANRYGAYSIGTVTNVINSAAMPTNFVLDAGVNTNDIGNYAVFKGLTGSSFTLIANAVTAFGNGFRAPINAIQIIKSTPPSGLSIAATATNVVISFPTGFRLQSAAGLTGPWTVVATNSPFMTLPTDASAFFRGISP